MDGGAKLGGGGVLSGVADTGTGGNPAAEEGEGVAPAPAAGTAVTVAGAEAG